MKKMIVTGLLAVCWIAASQQQASAWVNSKFGVGLNWDLQSANNSFFWGMWRNGQIPGPDMAGGMPSMPRYAPVPYPQQQGFMPRSYAPQPYPQQAYLPPPGYVQPAYAPAYQAEPVYNGQQYAGPGMTYNSLYHFANYPRQLYYYQGVWYDR